MPTKLSPYLAFQDNARQAMEFYQTVFGGKLVLRTFEEFHAARDPRDERKIMHSVLEGANGVVFMASDTGSGMEFKPGTNIRLSIDGENEAELRGYFEKLSAGGSVLMPLKTEMWGDTFGMVADKFGIIWMVNIAAKKT